VCNSLFVLEAGEIVEAGWKITKMRTTKSVPKKFAWSIFGTEELLNKIRNGSSKAMRADLLEDDIFALKQLPSHMMEAPLEGRKLGSQQLVALPWEQEHNQEEADS